MAFDIRAEFKKHCGPKVKYLRGVCTPHYAQVFIVIPDDLRESPLVRVMQPGFAGKVEAVRKLGEWARKNASVD